MPSGILSCSAIETHSPDEASKANTHPGTSRTGRLYIVTKTLNLNGFPKRYSLVKDDPLILMLLDSAFNPAGRIICVNWDINYIQPRLSCRDEV